MPNLLEILSVLQPEVSFANIAKLSEIITTILRLSVPITTRAIGRFGRLSLRTVERFYAQEPLSWTLIRILLFRAFLFDSSAVHLLVLDETTEKKAGKCSYGLDSFFSSLVGKVVPSVSFLCASVVNVKSEQSHFLSCTQLIKPRRTQEPSASNNKPQAVAKANKRKRGRPKGSKNTPYTEPESVSFRTFKTAVENLTAQLAKYCADVIMPYIVLDGFYGNQHYLKYCQEKGLKMISKLKSNAHLILPYTGKQKEGRGRPKKYDEKLVYSKIPKEALLTLPKDHKLNKPNTKVWALQVYADTMRQHLIQVVIIQNFSPETNKVGQTILFTDDLTLDPLLLIKYYSLRFQIEFDFRDAKQFFGLSDFKNYKENQLTNAVNIAFTCKLISQIVLEKYKKLFNNEKISILDLKAIKKAEMYYNYFLNTSEDSSHDFFNDQIFLDFVKLHAVNIR
jgi:putative transposase